MAPNAETSHYLELVALRTRIAWPESIGGRARGQHACGWGGVGRVRHRTKERERSMAHVSRVTTTQNHKAPKGQSPSFASAAMPCALGERLGGVKVCKGEAGLEYSLETRRSLHFPCPRLLPSPQTHGMWQEGEGAWGGGGG